ncbi:hypothetical protein DXG01_016815 [Tephrocybe rancida]|nr:hypothetical protein DXG01_016815 [Tephrocybe rancida]
MLMQNDWEGWAAIQTSSLQSVLRCPECDEDVKVGTGGTKNLGIHRTSKACRAKRENKDKKQDIKKSTRTILNFFQKSIPKNPSTVSAPPPILPGPLPKAHNSVLPAETHLPYNNASITMALPVCQHAQDLLSLLDKTMGIITADTPSAGRDHPLALFSGDPAQAASIGSASEDCENVLNPMFHGAFGWAREGGSFENIPEAMAHEVMKASNDVDEDNDVVDVTLMYSRA